MCEVSVRCTFKRRALRLSTSRTHFTLHPSKAKLLKPQFLHRIVEDCEYYKYVCFLQAIPHRKSQQPDTWACQRAFAGTVPFRAVVLAPHCSGLLVSHVRMSSAGETPPKVAAAGDLGMSTCSYMHEYICTRIDMRC